VRVVVVPADRGGCGYYRLVWPAQAVSLVRPDWSVEVVPPELVQAGFVDGRFIGTRGLGPPYPDVLVMQRVGTPGQVHTVRFAQEKGVATVVDFDDAMWCIDKGNMAWKSWNLSNPYDQHWRLCEDAAQVADLVTCTTDALAAHYGRRHGRTQVIPNYVPKAALDLSLADYNDTFTAGWAGFTKTHPGDCKVSRPAVETVLRGNGNLRVVADAEGAAAEWGVDPEVVDSIPSQKLGPSYYKAIARLDLMLVGLRDTPFNRAKSTLKVMEAAAVGVPSVASDNPPHRALAKAGFPVALASSPGEWEDAAALAMKRWMGEGPDSIALEMTNAMQDYTIESNAEQWARAWERAYERSQRR
jgi:glycosyltransferase involved in cell wall biosynthesis